MCVCNPSSEKIAAITVIGVPDVTPYHFDQTNTDTSLSVAASDAGAAMATATVPRGSHEGGLHPSLYPILLLLSKMRPATDDCSTSLTDSDEAGAVRQANTALFIPLVESCRGQYSQKVRLDG